MAVNRIDHLIQDCDDPASRYPARLQHTQLLPHSLQQYLEQLDERESRVFSKNPDDWQIQFWDCFDDQKGFPLSPHDCDSTRDIREYLLKCLHHDPICRHVFIEASHSWAPLNCSREMLVLLFTFHQVMPQFLDIVLSFGTVAGRNIPTAFYHCIFRCEHFLDLSPRRFEIPELGRSGHEIRHCYNLWSAERASEQHNSRRPWSVRQAGIYHSFDVETGRATWVHIKANALLQERITKATAHAEQLQAKAIQTVQGSFSATLLTHLIMIEWCGENWSQYIGYWECQVKNVLTKVKNAPVGKIEKGLMDDLSKSPQVLDPTSRQASFPMQSRRGTAVSGKLSRVTSRKSTMKTNNSIPLVGLSSRLQSILTRNKATAQSIQIKDEPVEEEEDPIEIFDDFKFEDLQRLHSFSTTLQEADMILKLNIDILYEIIEYYKSYVEDLETQEQIRRGCRSDMNRFVQRTSRIIREMRTERTRISTLIVLLEDGKAIFNAITQLRNIELNRRASKRMEEMTEDMHELTIQTKKDTSSMHFITFVTLVFLPGTFVATFLGAGFYQWPQPSDGNVSATFPDFRPRYFFLFLEISVGLTLATVLLWWEYVQDNSEQGIDGKNEKKPYISREKLAEHLDGDMILSLLSTNDRQVNIQTISTTLLQAFSILVWISKPPHDLTDYIRHFVSANFTDSLLPLAPPPKQGERPPYHQRLCPFPINPEGLDAWRQFSEEQWRFLPLKFCHPTGTPIERAYEKSNDVDIRQIRPITVLEHLHPESSSSAKIYKVQPHESSGLPEKYGNHPIILKEYLVDEFTGQFNQEHTAYMTINNNMHDMLDHRDAHFLRYYGAFRQGDKFVLLLEYCSEGTLLDLFKKCWYLPRKQEEARVLWAAALHLLEGLDFLHSVGGNSLIVHQDIKPANIFVFKDSKPGNPDRLLFKLGDFGMSSTSDPSARGEAEGPDYQGSRMYSAPEIPAWTESDQEIPRRISWHSDIWSFGCVLYEFALWMATFERGRIEFRQARIEATRHIPRVVDAGYRGAFHDGNEVLRVVEAKVGEMKNFGTPVASMSAKFMQDVLRYMLQPKLDMRLQARQLKLHLMDRLDKITAPVLETNSILTALPDSPQLEASPPPLVRTPTTPSSRHRLPSTPSRTSACELQGSPYILSSQSPMVSPVGQHVNDFRLSQNWSPTGPSGQSYAPHSSRVSYSTIPPVPILATTQPMIANDGNTTGVSIPVKEYRHSNYPSCTVEDVIRQKWPQKSKKQRDQSKLPGMERALRDLKGRDQCFILDNSSSMTGCWEQVKRTTLALASIVQDIDPDGFELFCTNTRTNTNSKMKTKDCKGLEGYLTDNQPYSDIGPCRMENHLDIILPEMVTKATKARNSWDLVRGRQPIKGINVYVLTNGVWENRDSEIPEAVAQSIRTIVNKVKRQGCARSFLSIQFVRFGQSSVGRERLQWLDDDLKYSIPDHWDIVDTTSHTGSVWKMLIGATSAFEDSVVEETEQTDHFI
ncbi:hypothetical protein GQX73_g2224 [Xylaria multiplex]|uniref:non-specific serine/threonine protein kinase n=1 Tax=Xylaria multiplex TaxID=323545 RepID=A0A7C8IVW1_9PEZI|nr:hypothetical protein GQX73_g2224 [Xylaria multiplex]